MPMREHNAPAVSVIMGVRYNRADLSLLRRSVRSILEQSCEDLELLICDDGSCQGAVDYLDGVAAADDRVALVRRGRLLLSAKLNACLEVARGRYIARMDDDDYSHPRRLQVQLDALAHRPEIAFVGSNVNLARNGRIVGARDLPEFPTTEDFLFVQPFIHPSLLFRREALVAVGGYDETARCAKCEDYDLLLRLYGMGMRGMNLQARLLDYTLPEGAKGSRTMADRWNEARTRYYRFRELKLLPQAWPYVAKPILVGMIPETMLEAIKNKRMKRG